MDALSVWIIDDNPSDVYLMQHALQAAGMPVEITVLIDGENAVNKIEECRAGMSLAPDIILLDLHLPKIGGLQVLKAIRETPEFKAARVAMFTSSPISTTDGDGKFVDVERWVQKPSTLETFISEIGRTVKDLSSYQV